MTATKRALSAVVGILLAGALFFTLSYPWLTLAIARRVTPNYLLEAVDYMPEGADRIDERDEVKVDAAIQDLTSDKLIAACGPPLLEETGPWLVLYYPDGRPHAKDHGYYSGSFAFRGGKLQFIEGLAVGAISDGPGTVSIREIKELLKDMPCLRAALSKDLPL